MSPEDRIFQSLSQDDLHVQRMNGLQDIEVCRNAVQLSGITDIETAFRLGMSIGITRVMSINLADQILSEQSGR